MVNLYLKIQAGFTDNLMRRNILHCGINTVYKTQKKPLGNRELYL